MDNPIYSTSAVLELTKLPMYETSYDELQPNFRERSLQFYYMDCDSFVLSIRTRNIINDLKNLEELIDLSNLNKTHEIYINNNETLWIN